MDILFNESLSRWTLFFKNSNIEEEYISYQINKQVLFDTKAGNIVAGIQYLFFLGFSIYELYVSTTPENTRYLLNSEIVFLCFLIIGLILEIACFFVKSLYKLRGAFMILAFVMIMSEATKMVAKCNAISTGGLTLTLFAIYIAVSYSKYWLFTSLAAIVGGVYFCVIKLMQSPATFYLKLTTCFTSACIVFWLISIFYCNESMKRKDFFAYYLAQGKSSELKKILQEIPVSIFYKRNKELSFLNSSLKSLLEISLHEEEDIKTLKKSERKIKYLDYLSRITCEENGKNLKYMISSNDLATNLYNFSFYIILNNQKLELKIKNIETQSFGVKYEVFVIHEISLFARIKSELEKKYQSILISSFSHEILTPTNGSIGIIDSLLSSIVDLKIKYKLRIVQKSCVKLIFFVNLLKNYTILENGNINLIESKFNVIESIEECVELHERDLRKKKVDLRILIISPKLNIIGDKNFLTQILFALISNATKHTYKGFVEINAEYTEDKSHIEFTIRDSGSGISGERLKNIFDLFSSCSSNTQLSLQGIGLQLYVSKKLAIIMKGDIFVKSILNEGSEFKVILPTNLPTIFDEENNQAEFEKSEFDADFNFSHLNLSCFRKDNQDEILSSRGLIVQIERVPNQIPTYNCKCSKYLIVDDDPTNVAVLKSYFKSLNVEADVAFNGKEAVEKVEVQNSKECCKGYSLIFMDINMPIMDGEEATRLIKRKIRNNEMNDCKVIAITATQILSTDHFQKFLDAGFCDVYNKPLPKATFELILKKYSGSP